jgi:acetyl-CoA/propionyl-CoA carboxylase, biotin carboxylase, biotin carboxyl carrier protein
MLSIRITDSFPLGIKARSTSMFKKILVANRGEIAVRVIRACHELDIKVAAIFSEPDKLSRHVSLADESWLLEGQPGKVYLDIQQIIDLAKRSGSEAIHPGYGFLAENPEFAEACEKNGIVFIGPSAEVIRSMGSKIESRRIMDKAGVPVVPGTTDPVSDVETVKKLCTKYGYPIAIKASAGGGGRGLRVVRKEEEVEQALAGAQREGTSYFGNGEVYIEKYLDLPRHIEVQILADKHGNVIHLGERDCSSQRRHQKLLEESPAAGLNPKVRTKLLEAAVKGAAAIGYSSAGTVECLVSGDDFYFLEMNTRVQVEHPVTEFVTGIDIVKEQIRVAAGEKLSIRQEDVSFRGHSIECRINAEDPFKMFMPSPGTVHTYKEPSLPWVRVDSACYQGYQILPFYDSLLAKLVCWGLTREEAIARTKIALKEFDIQGVATTIPFHLALLDDATFKKAGVYTGYVESEFKKNLVKPAAPATAPSNGSAPAGSGPTEAPVVRTEPRNFEISVNQKFFKVAVSEVVNENAATNGAVAVATKPAAKASTTKARPVSTTGAAGGNEVKSSMHGLVKELLVKQGDVVKVGQKLLIFEAMKMESEILAPRAGKIDSIKVKAGETVESSQLLLTIGD